MNSLPSISPNSWIGMMCCSRRPAATAGLALEAARYSGSSDSDSSSSFIATTRSWRVS